MPLRTSQWSGADSEALAACAPEEAYIKLRVELIRTKCAKAGSVSPEVGTCSSPSTLSAALRLKPVNRVAEEPYGEGC